MTLGISHRFSPSTRGYGGAKKINGRKRRLVVDTLGLLLMILVKTRADSAQAVILWSGAQRRRPSGQSERVDPWPVAEVRHGAGAASVW